MIMHYLLTFCFVINLLSDISGQEIRIYGQHHTPEYIEAQSRANLEWLKKKGIPLNALPLANPEEIIYDCDSNLLLKRVSGDTLIFWTSSSTSYGDTVEIQERIQNENFGRTSFISGINYQGNISYTTLGPKTFLLKNDTLFELETTYLIHEDSIFNLGMERFRLILDDREKSDSLQRIIDQNSVQVFKVIFHPDLFEERIYRYNILGDHIELTNVWQVAGRKYYKITITNQVFGSKTEYSYVFDDNYRFTKYDGCNAEELRQLIKDNEISP